MTPVSAPPGQTPQNRRSWRCFFLSFLKIKMEKSGLCMAPGVHRLHEACGWEMAALHGGRSRGRCEGNRAAVRQGRLGWAKAALLGEDVTEAQGGMTCQRPPCKKGEKHVPLCLGPHPAALGGRQPLGGWGCKPYGVSPLQEPWPVSIAPSSSHSDLRPGVLGSGPA